MARERSTGFLPSAHGFAFANEWPSGAAASIPLGVGKIGIGNAARGLCGGMVFAALDYWHAGAPPPAEQPQPGTPLFGFIVRRLVRSWRLPAGVGRYYRWMVLADADVARRTTRRHWPAIKEMLDAGKPAPLGVVTVASANPLLLGGNHQVLAYGYHTAGSLVTLHVYDPNAGQDDAVVIRWDGEAEPAAFEHNLGLGLPVRGFFLTRYRPARPPGFRTRRPRGRRAAGTPSC